MAGGMEYWPFFLTVGLFLLAGLAADELGRRTRLPRVTFLMLCGLLVGASGLDIVPPEVEALFDFFTVAALTMVAFLLGATLTRDTLAAHGAAILWISASIVVATIGLVALGLIALGMAPGPALALGAIAAATDPAATSDALKQAGARGRFADTLRGIVAIDDAWGLIAFSLVMVVAQGLNGVASDAALRDGLWEVFGALGLAVLIGGPAAYLTGRVRPGEPIAAEAIGIVFLIAGLAMWLEVSFLIVGMAVGTIIANFARHHTRAFHEVDRIQWPFMILFFILAGASFEIAGVLALGAVGLAFLVLRVLSRMAGGWIGARLAHAPRHEARWYGLALLPQAGVAIGMALVAAEAMPAQAEMILTLTIGSTIIFEVFGPVITILAARRVAAQAPQAASADTTGD